MQVVKMRLMPSALIAVAFATGMLMASASGKAAIITYDVNLTFDAGSTPFSANDVTGLISGDGTITGSFTVDDQTDAIDTVLIQAAAGATQIATYDDGPGYAGLTFGYNDGYSDASFSEPGYESPDFESLFFYPAGGQAYSGDDLFGSKIELYNGDGQRIAEFQLSGTIVPTNLPEPVGPMIFLAIGSLFFIRRPQRKTAISL
jgi:hypothetical protein